MHLLIDAALVVLLLVCCFGHRPVRLYAAFFNLSALLCAAAGGYLLSVLWHREAARWLGWGDRLPLARAVVFAAVLVAGFALLRWLLAALMGRPGGDGRGSWLSALLGLLVGAVAVAAACVTLGWLAQAGLLPADTVEQSVVWRLVRWAMRLTL